MVMALAFLLIGPLQPGPPQVAPTPPIEPTRPPDCLSCAPPSAEARPSVITQPRWLVRPEPAYPSAAMALGVSQGSAQLLCQVRPDGFLGVCDVVSEAPVGMGFGAAALAGARAARLERPGGSDFPPDARVNFNSRFLLD